MTNEINSRGDIQAALTRACEDTGVAAEHHSFVLAFLDRQDQGWRECCGSRCEPCSLDLAKAVDRLRELLGESPPS